MNDLTPLCPPRAIPASSLFCILSQRDCFKVWSRYHQISAQNISTAPIPVFCCSTWSNPCLHLWSHSLPSSPSFTQPHSFLLFLDHAKNTPCPRVCTCFSCSTGILSLHLPRQFTVYCLHRCHLSEGPSWSLYAIPLKEGFSEGPLGITLQPHPLLTCFSAFHSTCLFISLFFVSPTDFTRMWTLRAETVSLTFGGTDDRAAIVPGA